MAQSLPALSAHLVTTMAAAVVVVVVTGY